MNAEASTSVASVLDLFRIGLGPSSSHTVGPMLAGRAFAERLREGGGLAQLDALRVDLYGSLGATGAGHGSDAAVMLGLEGERPDIVEPGSIPARVRRIRRESKLRVLGEKTIAFSPDECLSFRGESWPDGHPNALSIEAFDRSGRLLRRSLYYSVGGGVVVDAESNEELGACHLPEPPHVSATGEQLLDRCADLQVTIAGLVLVNELTWRDETAVRAELLTRWSVMKDGIERGCSRDGILPGKLGLRRRAARLHRQVHAASGTAYGDAFVELDCVSLHAIAVAEENASGGRVVTAPTAGSAGIVPAVLEYALRVTPAAEEEVVVEFLLAAGAIGLLYRDNSSISGAEVGCQGEIGVAASMAAAGVAQVLGATPMQVEAAAEIAMEHSLGLTCDPVAGLVQVPCIERNALGAVTAIAGARLALQESGEHLVSLDAVIRTMYETGRDMHDKYKETSCGGLAAVLGHVSVGVPEC